MPQITILTSRGSNIGENVITTLKTLGFYQNVEIKSIQTERQPKKRQNKTVVKYFFCPKKLLKR